MARIEDSLTTQNAVALPALVFILAISILFRVYAYSVGFGAAGVETTTAPVPSIDMPQATILAPNGDIKLVVRDFVINRPDCNGIIVNTVDTSAYGPDPSLAGPIRHGDRVFYYYLGHVVGDAGLRMKLHALYVMRRASAALHIGPEIPRDNIGIKMSIPSVCDTDPNDVVAELHRPLAP